MKNSLQPKTPPPQRYRWWHFMILLLPICLGLYFVFTSQRMQTENDPFGWQLSRGTHQIALRLPETTGYLQEDLLISGSGTIQDPWRASRGPIDASQYTTGQYTYQELTLRQWQNLAALRDKWCTHQPTFQALSNQTYQIRFRCDEAYQHFVEFLIPEEALPEIFHELLRQIPSPQSTQ